MKTKPLVALCIPAALAVFLGTIGGISYLWQVLIVKDCGFVHEKQNAHE